MSEATKKTRKLKWIFFSLSVALNIVPMLVFFFKGFGGVETSKKVILSFTAVIALVLGAFMIISKLKWYRTLFWIIFFVMSVCFTKTTDLIITMGICNIVDEIIVNPLYKKYSSQLSTHKLLDKRL